MKSDLRKKKAQLVEELEMMRRKVSELEAYKTSYLESEEEQECEEKLRLMFESVTDGITVTDLDGTITNVNKAILELGGFGSESDIVGKSAFESIVFRDRERALADMMELLKQDTVGTRQYHLLRTDGSEYPAEVSAGLLKDADGNPAGFISVIRDITERKQAEELFQRILLRLPVGVYIMQDGRFVFANPQLLSDLGITEEKLLGVKPLSRVRSEDRETVRRNAVEMLKGRRTTPYEYGVTGRDGVTRWFMETVVPIQYRGKRAVLGNLLNITERKRTEERLLENQYRFHDLVNLLPLGVFEIDDQYNVTFANQQAGIMLGYENADLDNISLFVLDTCVSEDRERMKKNVERIMNGDDLGGNEYTLRRVNGTTFPAVVHSTPIMQGDKVVGLRGVIIDVTERKQTEERLRESRRRFRDLVNLLPQGVYELDDKYTITFANRWAIETAGYTEEEVNAAPMNALDIVIPEDRERMRKNIERIMNGEKLTDVEYTHVNKDGSTKPVVTYSAPIMRDGKAVGLRGVTIDISERKQAENLLRDILNNSPISVYILQDDRFQLVNPAFCQNTGYTEDELLAIDPSKLVHPYDLEMVGEKMVEMLEGKLRQPFEFRGINKDGSVHWVIVSVAPIRYRGKPAMLATPLNITERKQMEEIFQTISMSSPASIYIVQDGKFVFANHRLLDRVGLAEDELPNTGQYDLIHPEDREMVRRSAIEMLKGIRTTPYEYRAINKSGEMMWVAETVASIQYQGRRAVLGSALNITERKHAEEALQESEEKYRILVENSQDSIIIVDFEGTIQLANEASTRLSGYSLDEGIGMNIMEILTPAYWEEALKKLQQAKNGESVPYFEAAIKRKDGIMVAIEACGQAIFKDGEAMGAQVIIRDITERKRVDEERQRIERLESLGTLAGGIAHDFNNILTGIMGNIGLALRHMEPEGRATERLLEAEKASLRARNLTQQLLTFSKGSPPIKKNVALGQLIEEAASFALRGSNVRFELALAHDIWSVNVDEGQINGVISNLVINADEAMPEGGTIKIGARNRAIGLLKFLPLPRGNYVEVTVEDNGVGIPKEHLGRIFEPYFTTKQKGSGLGLATAYSIVKNHDGYISVESKLGVGTTFHVFLPASKESAPMAKARDGESSAPVSGRILVMDDEEAIQQLLHRALTEVGYEVLLTGDGEEAIEQYTRAREAGTPFDAVILDLTVPGKMGGREAIKKLAEIDPGVRAIASSGYSTDPVISDFRNHGFRGVVVKPYRISELREALREVIVRKRG